jgi:signal transduction histidine kinase
MPMLLKDAPIQHKLMRVILLTSGAVLLLTCSAYFAYEFFSFRHTTLRQLSTLGKIIANNSTAALAFSSHDDADEILSSLRAEPHIVAACLYDEDGNLFSYYPSDASANSFPPRDTIEQYRFENSFLIGFQPVVQGETRLGTLYLKSDMGAMYERLQLYGIIAVLVVSISLLLAYLLSKRLQQGISKPILALAETAKAISERKDYSVRAEKVGRDELGSLTDAFNQMLSEIQAQNEQIQAFNQKLEQTITERTHDLEAANKELEAFSYSVSHDLRAPLRSINGYSRILMDDYGDKLDDEGKQTVNTIMRNGDRMGRLIDDLLAFSRLGRQNLTKVSLDMQALTNSALTDELRNQYGRNSEIKIGEMLPIKGDSSMLKQVMENLVSNALKYSMKKEKPLVEIGSYQENGSNVYYVKDNGAGFNMEYYDKLFGVFQRLHSANEFEGTGVGLALVHRIVTKHGGKIWAEGKENKGATFYFSLPLT